MKARSIANYPDHLDPFREEANDVVEAPKLLRRKGSISLGFFRSLRSSFRRKTLPVQESIPGPKATATPKYVPRASLDIRQEKNWPDDSLNEISRIETSQEVVAPTPWPRRRKKRAPEAPPAKDGHRKEDDDGTQSIRSMDLPEPDCQVAESKPETGEMQTSEHINDFTDELAALQRNIDELMALQVEAAENGPPKLDREEQLPQHVAVLPVEEDTAVAVPQEKSAVEEVSK